jgi:hypothetical protein
LETYRQVPSVSQFTMAMDVSGREYLSLVAKSTFDFPDEPGRPAQDSAMQRDLVYADTYVGEPGLSAPQWETDFAFRKHQCDVIVNGAAYSQDAAGAEKVRVGVRVGAWKKYFDVYGDREWINLGPSLVATQPLRFRRQPFSYGTAFGGVDRLDPDDPLPACYTPNPVGTGWAQRANRGRVTGLPLPNTQSVDEDVSSPFGAYTPMSLGPYGRGWPDRIRYGGTYDQHWQDEIFPFLPPDFDERYYQSAPAEQQIPYPRSGTEVTVVGMTPRGRETFRLRGCELPITVFRGRQVALERTVLPDTLAIDTEARSFSLAWRIEVPIRRIITEFTEAWIGPPTEAMLRARREGRRYIRAVATDDAEESLE